MTREQLKLPTWAIPILIPLIVSAVVAWTQLHGKEDAGAHNADLAETRRLHTADVVKQQGQIDSIRFAALTSAVRDSAWKADAMRILLELKARR